MRVLRSVLVLLSFISVARGQELVAAGGAKLIPIAPGWAANSVNVVSFRRQSITTFLSTQYVAFYDPAGKVMLATRDLSSQRWEIGPTHLSGDVRDAHNAICIAVDGVGILHMAIGHHNQPLRYIRFGEEIPMTGTHENKVTYPEFYNLPDGGLLFMYRDGASGNGNLVIDRYNLQTHQWKQLHENLIDGEHQRNAYCQAAVDSAGTIHLSWVWRESPDVASNHDLCYAKSLDGGKTWVNSAGKEYTIPITAESAEYAVHIPQKHELINQTSMTTDANGRPYIATYWRDEGTEIPQYRLVYHDGAAWRVMSVGEQTIPFRLGGTGTKRIPISRPQVLIDSAASATKGYLLFRDQGRGNKVSIAACDDLSKAQWHTIDLTAGSVGMWEPSYDQSLWQRDKTIHAFVQHAEQNDAEGVADAAAQMVYVLEYKPK